MLTVVCSDLIFLTLFLLVNVKLLMLPEQKNVKLLMLIKK